MNTIELAIEQQLYPNNPFYYNLTSLDSSTNTIIKQPLTFGKKIEER